ncbi:DsbA family protein [Nonomuraea sp. NPDC050536]|uniref:DsbA family protein n=1 Tax=Nonomuraea sp. NPDC050536 TaxID=3364366 RepID=UPI0037CAA918
MTKVRVLLGFLVGAVLLMVLGVAALGRDDDSGSAARIPGVAASTGSRPAGSPSATPAVSDGATPTWEGPTPPPVDQKLMRGSAQAPVTVVEFGDFKCPNCRNFAQKIEPALKAKYLDTGIIRIFWRDYPIRGRDSIRAAIAARAAARQNRFWDFYQALYTGHPSLTDAGLRSVAANLGLDLPRFDADVKDPAVRRAVEDDRDFATEIGMPGTPAFLINGELLFGAQPQAVFEQAIEKARAEQ